MSNHGVFKLCGFADEISPDLGEQIRVCKALGLTHIELRGVYGKNVLDFDDALASEVKSRLKESGLGVASIGSPVGKVPVDAPWEGPGGHRERFRKAVQLARFFDAPFIRLFSYYNPSKGGSVLEHRDEVLRRFRDKVAILEAEAPGVTMVHENEHAIYGEKGRQCLDLMSSIESPRLRMAFDFANFVQCGERPLDNWPMLKPYTVHVHVKDAVMGSGKVVPAGEGDGQLEPILLDLARSGYDGFLSLEPHLAAHGQFSGFSGPELFTRAAEALKSLLARHGLKVAAPAS